ncbi:methionine aminotransferase [Portibacter lacus]|uniref:Aminotransferase n=1 Tax=Portibacter lacus TaxID=1099794 RepID=A0AA37SQA3_9BACT|nr:methionine aminotransferase [Portibacter lacus]GLR17364.1 aminotransferase [Portibacter lacus]
MRSKLPHTGTTIFSEMSGLAAEHKAINLSQGFPNFEPDQALRDRVQYHMNHGKNQYAPMAGVLELRQKISQKIQNLYDVVYDPSDEINVTAGGTQAIFTAISAFVFPGDEVIVIEPAFDCYHPAIELIGAKVVSYEMSSPDFKVDWDEVEKLMTSKTSMIIINTPHNPTGSILRDSDMKALISITLNKDIIILSDEVYEHLIYDNEQHCSILAYPALRSKSIAVFSFGKTFHCTGWKIGYTVMSSALMKEFRKVHQFNVFSVNSFVQHGIADYLADSQTYLSLPDFYQEKRDLLSKYIQNSKFKLIPSKGSYFILADYSQISDLPDTEFAKWLTIKNQLACIPISVFYQSKKQEKLVRFCFAKTEDVLHKAGEIIQSIV